MSVFQVPYPVNEPIKSYAPGTIERAELEVALEYLKANPVEIPMVIDGEDVKTDKKINITAPHNHEMNLGYYYQGGESDVKDAVDTAMGAYKTWSMVPWEHRAAIFLKASPPG